MKMKPETLSISEIKRKLEAKEISSVEITRFFLERIEKYSRLNSFITVCKDTALKQAEEADSRIKRGESAPLLGVPYAIKDMILTEGIRTTAASKILENFIAPYDATVVKKLKEAGAVILGKTNLDEFAMGSSNETSYFGAVKNPWDETRVPGGSSGGSASAVSARLTTGALGTDTGGSIRQPASFCGIVGIKPTYGRVSRNGVVAYASSLDQVGTFASDTESLAMSTEVIMGYDPLDSTSVDAPIPDLKNAAKSSVKGLRIGIPKEYFIKGLNSEIECAIKSAVKLLESAGAIPVEISLPHTELALAVYYILAPAEASSNLSRYDGIRYGHRAKDVEDLFDLYCKTRTEGFGREVKRRIMIGTYVLSAGYYDAFYLKAQRVRRLIRDDFSSAFEKKCDVIACPAAPTTAFPIGSKTSDPLEMYLGDVFTIPVNLAGLPGLCIPCGMDSSKLPIGLHLIGKPFDEVSLFKVAGAYESMTDWHKQLPPAITN